MLGWEGEACYQGKPTSYWSREVKAWHERMARSSPCGPPLRLPAWWDQLIDKLGILGPTARMDYYPIALLENSKDPATIPVLIQLLQDSDEEVRASAAASLGRREELAEVAVPALTETQHDVSPVVGGIATAALARITRGRCERGRQQ